MPLATDLLEWLIALTMTAVCITTVYRIGRRGWIDSGSHWTRNGPAWLIVTHIIFLVVLWILKSLQISAEKDDFSKLYLHNAIVRRFDDISFWTMLMGTVVGSVTIWYAGGLRFARPTSARLRRSWITMAIIGTLLYLVAVAVGNGTFFHRSGGKHAAIVAKCQIVEGTIVLLYILTSYIFICSLIDAIVQRKRRAIAVGIGVIAGCTVAMIGIATAVTQVGMGLESWRDCGFTDQVNYSNERFWFFALMVWWPWLVLFLVTLFFSSPNEEATAAGSKKPDQRTGAS